MTSSSDNTQRKTGSILSFSLLPVVTCSPEARATCGRTDCYACKMCNVNKDTRRAWQRNTFMATEHLPPSYILTLVENMACHASQKALDAVRDACSSSRSLEALASVEETAERVKAARLRQRDVQDEFAWRLNVSLYRVQQWERGKSPLPLYVLRLVEFYVAFWNMPQKKQLKGLYRNARIEVPADD